MSGWAQNLLTVKNAENQNYFIPDIFCGTESEFRIENILTIEIKQKLETQSISHLPEIASNGIGSLMLFSNEKKFW